MELATLPLLGGHAPNLEDVTLGEMKGPGGDVDALPSLHLKRTTFTDGKVAVFSYSGRFSWCESRTCML